jgi:hypothetical protein
MQRDLQLRGVQAGPFKPSPASCASPNGLPSESLQVAHASPGWITFRPSASTRSNASATSCTAKYGSEKESPGPRPRAWHADRRRARVRLPAFSLSGPAIVQFNAEKIHPEVTGALWIVGGNS